MNTNLLVTQLAEAKPLHKGTTLVTYLIPSYTDIWLYSRILNNEFGTAKNIKRKAVTGALKRAMYLIKNYKGTKSPENGLVLCTGEIMQNQSYL